MSDSIALPWMAFDTTSPLGSVALKIRGKIITEELPVDRINGHASLLIPCLERLLKREGLTFSQIGCFITPRGPGSFTGVRLGLATIQGFLLAGVGQVRTPTLFEVWRFWAQEKSLGSSFLMARLAKQDFLYTQEIQEGTALEPALLPSTYLEAWQEKGGVLISDEEGQGGHHPPSYVAPLLINWYEGIGEKGGQESTPLYVHSPSFKKKG